MTPPPNPKQSGRSEKDERDLASANKKLERKGVDTSKMPGNVVREGRKGNA